MMQLRFILGLLILILFFNSCREKLLIYSTKVVDEDNQPIIGAEIDIIRNGILQEKSKTMTPTHEEVILMNEEKMTYPLKSDSLGVVSISFVDKYLLFPDDMYLLISKENFDTAKIKLDWKISIDNTVTLNSTMSK